MSGALRTFDGAVAIVTGAASGIGRALAEALAARGSEVVLADLDLPEAEAVAAEIRAGGGRASAARVDVSRLADVEDVVGATFARRGRLDYLFNNAGIAVMGEVADHTPEAWDRILGANLMGVIHGIQCGYPRMVGQGFGHIVNTASVAGLLISPGLVSYTTTKHAVVALSQGLRAEAHGHGVRVSVLCPGAIRTPLLSGGRYGLFLGSTPEERQRALAVEFFERMRPMPAPVFARKALDRIARNRAIIVMPFWCRLVWWMARASPALALFFARKGVERGRVFLAAEPPSPPRGM